MSNTLNEFTFKSTFILHISLKVRRTFFLRVISSRTLGMPNALFAPLKYLKRLFSFMWIELSSSEIWSIIALFIQLKLSPLFVCWKFHREQLLNKYFLKALKKWSKENRLRIAKSLKRFFLALVILAFFHLVRYMKYFFKLNSHYKAYTRYAYRVVVLCTERLNLFLYSKK